MTNENECILAEFRADGCETCDRLCAHRIALHGLNGDGGRIASAELPVDYRNVTLANSPAREGQAKVYEAVTVYADSIIRHLNGGERAKSLYLWSESPGTGKTTTACALINAWIARDYLSAIRDGIQPKQRPAYFLDVNAFQTEYNLATMTNDEGAMKRIGGIIKRVQTVPFAVIDDIGVRSVSEAFRSYVHAIINHRVSNGMPTVYTSNLSLKEMAGVFDQRLYDRIREQCAPIHFAGTSKRGRR